MNFLNFLFDSFDLLQNSYVILIHFLTETILDLNILNFVWFSIAIIFLTRGPSLETIRNVAMTLGGLSTFAIATGVGGPRRNRAEEESAKRAEDDARTAKEEAKSADLNARLARDEAAQTKALLEATQKRVDNLEAFIEATKK